MPSSIRLWCAKMRTFPMGLASHALVTMLSWLLPLLPLLLLLPLLPLLLPLLPLLPLPLLLLLLLLPLLLPLPLLLLPLPLLLLPLLLPLLLLPPCPVVSIRLRCWHTCGSLALEVCSYSRSNKPLPPFARTRSASPVALPI